MNEDIPSSYDVIVVGTGMTESIIAAAASRVGQRVLHLDSNSYYGDLWATFNFKGIEEWISSQSPKVSEENLIGSSGFSVPENCSCLQIKNVGSLVSNIEERFFIEDKEEETPEPTIAGSSANKDLEQVPDDNASGPTEEPQEIKPTPSEPVEPEKQEVSWSQKTFLENSRKYNLDLAPKLLFAKGSLVELLISSNIGRYTEFRSVTRVLTWINNRLQPVPCSRADVFATTDVSVVEKRMLMKLLTSFTQSDSSSEFEAFQDKTFLEFLKSKKLPNNLIHYVLHAIAMGTEKTSFKEGLSRSQLFLSSLGRYSNSPFLWSMYGSGELPQCFCRLCAVFGGIYHLKKGAEALVISDSDNSCKGIVSEDQIFSAPHVVLGVSSFPKSFLVNPEKKGLSRGIFVTDRSILPSEKEQLTLLQYPINNRLITVIEVGPATCACPTNQYVVHMTCKQEVSAQEDLLPIVSNLFNPFTLEDDEKSADAAVKGDSAEISENWKPRLLWALYYNVLDTSPQFFSPSVPANVHLCSGPDGDLDFDASVNQAKSIFSRICPEEEFLPRAPDPEEIVLEDAEPAEEEKPEESSEKETTNETANQENECLSSEQEANVQEIQTEK
nr:PREDICTED: rab proteins geranylgeranyltransferase component A 1 [Bemisia tabaci]